MVFMRAAASGLYNSVYEGTGGASRLLLLYVGLPRSPPVHHTPLRSGWPSAIRGVGPAAGVSWPKAGLNASAASNVQKAPRTRQPLMEWKFRIFKDAWLMLPGPRI